MRFNILDSFRGICAICVIFIHLPIKNSFINDAFFSIAGSYFVTFFFVLSGFVMQNILGGDFNFKKFLCARFFRIFPLHIALLLIIALIELIHLVLNIYFGAHYSINLSISNFILNILLVQELSPLIEATNIIGPAWSLSVEFYTYIIFAICASYFIRRIYIYIALILIGLWRYFGDLYFISKEFLICIECFFMGCVTHIIYIKIKDKINFSLLLANILEILIFVIIFLAIIYRIEKAIALIFSLCILIFVVNINKKTIISSILNLSLFKLLGRLSYSIYLSHVVVLGFIGGIMGVLEKRFNLNSRIFDDTLPAKFIYDLGSHFLNNVFIILCVIAIIIFSYFTYILIERVWINKGKKIIKNI